MNLNIDSTPVELNCPLCAAKFKEQLGRLKNDPTINCPGCHQPIKIEAGNLRQGLKDVDKSLADLKRSLGRIGKR